MKTNRYEVVILGAGPSGAMCALRLAGLGLRPLVVDKARFPRTKVCGCCLNLAAHSVMHHVGLSSLPTNLGGVPLTQWKAGIGKTSISCALPGGWALSRSSLDHALVGCAIDAGARFQSETTGTITSVDSEGVRIRLQTGSHPAEDVSSGMVVVATGLSGGGLERWLPWRKVPSGPLGASVLLHCEDTAYREGVIYMACSSGGYVGIVRTEDGRLDVAAAIGLRTKQSRLSASNRRRSDAFSCRDTPDEREPASLRRNPPLASQMADIVAQVGFPRIAGLESAPLMTTPRLRRLRTVGKGRLIAIGDAAGYVEPFTGEGMAWAMQSGVAAAECVAEAFQYDPQELGNQWKRRRNQLLRRRQLPCKLLTSALHNDLSRRVLFATLDAAPWLARPVIGYLNRSVSS